jgi:hypothetical protein
MTSWIFQGNPEAFDIDGYLQATPGVITWTVSRYANQIAVGDTVFLWKAQGNDPDGAGVVAEGTVVEVPKVQLDDPLSDPFWKKARDQNETMRTRLRVNRVASSREVLKRSWMMEDSVLRDMLILRQAAGTNYRLTDAQADRVGQLWRKTGRGWRRDEIVAALWLYEQLRGKPISRTPGSLVEQTAQKIGRAQTGVYNKLMNLRAVDPTDDRAGLAGGSRTDESVWHEFFDPIKNQIDADRLGTEYTRLWGNEIKADIPLEIALEDEERRLAQKSVAELLEDYNTRPKIDLPRRRQQQTMEYDRDPRVVVLRKMLAQHRCEVQGCSSARFQVESGEYFVEVHHLLPLAEGGRDVLENTVALCPTHHRLLHHAVDSAEIFDQLQKLRAGESKHN